MFAHFFPSKKQPEEREEVPSPSAKMMPPVNPIVSAAFNDFLAAQKHQQHTTERHSRKYNTNPHKNESLSGLNETLLTSSTASPSLNMVDVLLHHPDPMMMGTTPKTTTTPPSSNTKNSKAAAVAFLKLRDHIFESESSGRDGLLNEAHELFRHIWVNMQAERQQLQRVMSTDEALRLLSRLRHEKEMMEERNEEMRFAANLSSSPRSPHSHSVHFMEESGERSKKNFFHHTPQHHQSQALTSFLSQPPVSDEFIHESNNNNSTHQNRIEVTMKQRGRLAAPQPKTSDRNAASRLQQPNVSRPDTTATLSSNKKHHDEELDTPQSVPQKVQLMLDRRCSDMEKLQLFITNLESENQKMRNALTFEQRRSEGLFQKAQLLQRKLQSTREEALVWREQEREKMRVTMMEMEMRFERREQLLLHHNRGVRSTPLSSSRDIDDSHLQQLQGKQQPSDTGYAHGGTHPTNHPHPLQYDVRDAYRKPITPLHFGTVSPSSQQQCQTPQHNHHNPPPHNHVASGNISVTASSIGGGGAERIPSWSIGASNSTHQPSNHHIRSGKGEGSTAAISASSSPAHHRPYGMGDDPNERDLAALNVYLMEKSKDPGNCVLFEARGYPFSHASPPPPTAQNQYQLYNNNANRLSTGNPLQQPQSALTPSIYDHHQGADADVLRHYQQQWHYSLALTREFYRNKLDDESSSTSEIKSKLADAEIALKFKEGALSMKDNEISSLKNALQAFQQLSEEAVRGTKEGRYMYLSSTAANNTAVVSAADSLRGSASPAPASSYI